MNALNHRFSLKPVFAPLNAIGHSLSCLGKLRRLRKLFAAISLMVFSSFFCASTAMAATDELEPKQRVQDLNYGRVLYEFHQGKLFEALTTLNVVNTQGNIQGHGDHPKLVEAGLQLSYGMVSSAKSTLESLIDEAVYETLPALDRTLAWFYMAKVLYLQEKIEASLQAFARVDRALLGDEKPKLMREQNYLLQLISQKYPNHEFDLTQTKLPEGSIWQHYLDYNQAVLASDEKAGVEKLKALAAQLEDRVERYLPALNRLSNYTESEASKMTLPRERIALLEQVYLSIAKLYLRMNASDTALHYLGKIRQHSVFADQAHFSFAVAASHAGQFGLALESLQRLKQRELFTPWLQQVPYAMAYLYEQMGDDAIAVEAYGVAVEHHENLDARLRSLLESVSEQSLIETFQLEAELGSEDMVNDRYGRISVKPKNYQYALLLASESFQSQISDLHELYKIKNGLSRWQAKLDSFADMMALRIDVRNRKIADTQQALVAQKADEWNAHSQAWAEEVGRAVEDDNIFYFMTEEQRDYYDTIESAESKLAEFPDSHPLKEEFSERLERARDYFYWWVSEQYAVNRWAAQKQVRLLQREIQQFNTHQANLMKELSSEEMQLSFQQRIISAQSDLQSLQTELESSLGQVRENILRVVRAELQRQLEDNLLYLREARKSLARVADTVYHAAAGSASEANSEAGAANQSEEPIDSQLEETAESGSEEVVKAVSSDDANDQSEAQGGGE